METVSLMRGCPLVGGSIGGSTKLSYTCFLRRFFVTECVHSIQSSFHYNYYIFLIQTNSSEMKTALADFRSRAGYHDETNMIAFHGEIRMITMAT